MTYPTYKGRETCQRCHKAVDKNKAVWQELCIWDGIYYEPGKLKPKDSQGCFAFGPDCIKAVRKNRKGWKFIGRAVKDGASR